MPTNYEKAPEDLLVVEQETGKKHIAIVLVEDDSFFNFLVKNYILTILDTHSFKTNYEIEFYSYTNGKKFLDEIKYGSFEGKRILAFLDYYLEDGINGLFLLKAILSKNKKNLAVIFTQSNDYQIWLKLRTSGSFMCMHKDELNAVNFEQLIDKMFQSIE